jgi:hypothetical protein
VGDKRDNFWASKQAQNGLLHVQNVPFFFISAA